MSKTAGICTGQPPAPRSCRRVRGSALAFSDDDQIELMFDVLMLAGAQVQIMVLTCRKHLLTRLGPVPLEKLA